MTTILLIIVILMLIGALPTWPYSSGWGYYPSGGLGLIVLILIILLLTGRVSRRAPAFPGRSAPRATRGRSRPFARATRAGMARPGCLGPAR